jgi:hypothetical protein
MTAVNAAPGGVLDTGRHPPSSDVRRLPYLVTGFQPGAQV